MVYPSSSPLFAATGALEPGAWVSVPITGTITGVTASMPAWAPDNGARLDQLFATWNSGAPVFIGDTDIDGYYLAAAGGHNNYGGNQVYWLRWADLTLHRLTDADSYDDPLCYGENPPCLIDGGARPSARESYAGVVYERNRGEKGSVILIGGAPYQEAGSSTPSVYALDLAKLHAGAPDYWMRLADRADNAEGTVAFIDPPTGWTVFVSSPGRLRVIDYATDTEINASGRDYDAAAYSGGWDWEHRIFVKIEDPSAFGGRVSAWMIGESGAASLTDDISAVGNHGGGPTYDASGARYAPPWYWRLHLVYDEDIDKFVASDGGKTIYFLDALSDPSRWTWTSHDPATGPARLDFDAGPYHRWFALPDPYDDVYALWRHGEDAAIWLYKLETAAPPPPPPPPSRAGRTLDDLDGDGRSDLVWRHATGEVAVWLMDGSSPRESRHRHDVDPGWSVAGRGDLDGDGMSDLVWRRDAGEVAVWLMDGATVRTSEHRGDIGPDWALVATADASGDGKADLVWRHAAGELRLWLMDGPTATESHALGRLPSAWSAAGAGDVDGDGRADLIWRHAGGEVAIWLMDGASVKAREHRSELAGAWSLAATGDLDRAGRADLVWRHATGEIAFWLMDGVGPRESHHCGDIGPDWSILRAGDLDGDGRADLVWRHDTGEVAIWLMDGAGVAESRHYTHVPADWMLM
ncbi:MAG: VCBS repeat-containing protein [Alphaproteobacteria bacterium]|nr:VCBS repeat-containing protein [Alphaproteobacteria bacterium]